MRSKTMLRPGVAVLLIAAAAAFAGCEGGDGGGAERIMGPAAGPAAAPQSAVVQDRTGEKYTLIETDLTSLLRSTSITQLIGLSGGTITLAGHRLSVPVGAVTRPTLFTMTLLPTGVVEVELLALRSGLLGRLLNVGSSGFRRPVRVSLSYAGAKNITDESRLVILRRPPLGIGVHERVQSEVDESERVVTAELEHFSRYCLASN